MSVIFCGEVWLGISRSCLPQTGVRSGRIAASEAHLTHCTVRLRPAVSPHHACEWLDIIVAWLMQLHIFRTSRHPPDILSLRTARASRWVWFPESWSPLSFDGHMDAMRLSNILKRIKGVSRHGSNDADDGHQTSGSQSPANASFSRPVADQPRATESLPSKTPGQPVPPTAYPTPPLSTTTVTSEPPLWSRAYEALREEDTQLVDRYEKLLSRELPEDCRSLLQPRLASVS